MKIINYLALCVSLGVILVTVGWKLLASNPEMRLVNTGETQRYQPRATLNTENKKLQEQLQVDNVKSTTKTTSHPLKSTSKPSGISTKSAVTKNASQPVTTAVPQSATKSFQKLVLSPFNNLTIMDFRVPPWPVTNTDERLLYHHMGGQLGNHMFQFAGLYAIAKLTNRTVVLVQDDLVLQHFPAIETHVKIMPNKEMAQTIGNLSKKVIMSSPFPYAFHPLLLDNIINRNNESAIFLAGGFGSWKYFLNVEKEMKKFYQLSAAVTKKAQAKLNQITWDFLKLQNKTIANKDIVYIGIHNRHKPVWTPSHDKDNIRIAPPGYFKSAMDMFRKKYSHPLFVILTDDINITSKTLLGPRDVFIASEPKSHYIDDLALLLLCNHTIRSHGTFGWWASYLVGGESFFYYPYLQNVADHFRPSEIGLNGNGHVMSDLEKALTMNISSFWIPKGDIKLLKYLRKKVS